MSTISIVSRSYEITTFQPITDQLLGHVQPYNGGYSQNGAGRVLRGTFAHGSILDVWLVAWGRENLTFGELRSLILLEYAQGDTYRRSLCSKNLKNARERELEQDFFSDRWQWAVWDSEQRTTLQSGLYSDTECGWRQQATPSLGFCFPHKKEFHT